MEQDKGRSVDTLDRSKYVEKCLAIINTEKIKTLNKDPTKTTE